MKETKINVEEWVAMFKSIGLDEAGMMAWHKLFESRHPEAHRSFLEWLGLAPHKIEEIRAQSR
jgi:hypothetical protein